MNAETFVEQFETFAEAPRFFRPERPTQTSPGQRPGVSAPVSVPALKGRNISRTPPCVALTGLRNHVGILYSGRCPGLVCGAPTGRRMSPRLRVRHSSPEGSRA